MRRALYAGSFDPVTMGHVDVIARGALLFDELLVAVGNNPAKRYLFPSEERVRLVRETVAADNVRVVAFEGLAVDAARIHGANVLLRGIRAMGDFELEFRNGLANRHLSGLETLFLLTGPEWVYVSSSLVREIAAHGGDVSGYVPPVVLEALRSRP